MPIIKAITASTQTNVAVDAHRTRYIYSLDALKEVCRQTSNPEKRVPVLLQAPVKKSDFNMEIGKVLDSVIIEQNGQQKVLSNIYIQDERLYYEIMAEPGKMAFFPILGLGDLRKYPVVYQDGKDEVMLLQPNPPFTVLALNIGPKRSSSNIFLEIVE